jgi:hypothetical protein
VIFSRQDERKGFGEDAKIMSRPHSEPAPAVNNRLGSVRLRQMSIIAVALILGSWGCQSVSTGLHDQLVREARSRQKKSGNMVWPVRGGGRTGLRG